MDKMGVQIRPLLFISKNEAKRPFPLQAEYLKPEGEHSEGCRYRKGTGTLGWMFSQQSAFQHSRISWWLLTCTKLGPNRRLCVVTERQGVQMLGTMASCSQVLRCKASIRTQQQWLGTAHTQAALHRPEELQCEGPAEASLRVVSITRSCRQDPGAAASAGSPQRDTLAGLPVPPGAAPPVGTRRAGWGCWGARASRTGRCPGQAAAARATVRPAGLGGLCRALPRPAPCLVLPQPSLRCSPVSLSDAALVCLYSFVCTHLLRLVPGPVRSASQSPAWSGS